MHESKLQKGNAAEVVTAGAFRLVAAAFEKPIAIEFHPDAYFPAYDFKVHTEDGWFTVEVKHDSHAARTGKVYVEFEQYRQGAWRPSGIQTTEADFWVFVTDIEKGLFFTVETDVLRELALDAAWAGHIKQTQQKSAHADGKWPPTRGALVSIDNINRRGHDDDQAA